MPALKLTRNVAARCRIKREDLQSADPSDAVLGNWYVTLQHMPEGNAFVYMSERSLLSFIMLEGERLTPEKLSICLVRGMLLVLEQASSPPAYQARLLAEYSTGTFARADDLSLLGSLSNIAQDYAALIEQDGGVSRCSISNIVMEINSTPMKRLGYDTPYEVTAALLGGASA